MPSVVIRYFRYDSAKRELEVTFVTGRRYVYRGVPADVNREIRDRYAYHETTHEHSD
jgi:hypothetical protein